MRIAKPLDWQEITATDLDVVIEADRQHTADCALWTSEAFFGGTATEANVLARAPVFWHAPDGRQPIGHARLRGLQPWKECVLVIRAPDGGVLAASGVRLGSTPARSWLRHGLRLHGAEAAAGLRHPMPVVACPWSHIPAAAAEPAPRLPSLHALLHHTGPAVATLPLLQRETLDAHAVLDDMLCLDPADQPRAARLLAASPYAASAPYVALMHDAVAMLPAGLVFPGGTRLWSDSTHAAFWLDPELAQHPALFRAHGQLGAVFDQPRTVQDLLADNELTTLPGIPLLSFGNAWRNHGHWLLNTVFAAYLLRDAIAAHQVCVLVPEHSDAIHDTLRAVGVPRSAILVARPGTYRFERALFPSTLSIHANTFPPRALGAMFRHIARTTPDPAAPAGPERIYLTRQGSPTQRWMTDEAALIEALRARGFVVVAPHDLTFEEEVRCFSRARVVVGQLGAGLLNVGFAPPGCRVVEITTHNYALNDVWFLCGVTGHRFSRIMAHGSTEDEFAVTPFTFDLPLAPALALIDDVLNRP